MNLEEFETEMEGITKPTDLNPTLIWPRHIYNVSFRTHIKLSPINSNRNCD
jgi:hypothetical protein